MYGPRLMRPYPAFKFRSPIVLYNLGELFIAVNHKLTALPPSSRTYARSSTHLHVFVGILFVPLMYKAVHYYLSLSLCFVYNQIRNRRKICQILGRKTKWNWKTMKNERICRNFPGISEEFRFEFPAHLSLDIFCCTLACAGLNLYIAVELYVTQKNLTYR